MIRRGIVLPGRAADVRATVARTAHPRPARTRVAPIHPARSCIGHPAPLRAATTAGHVPGDR